MTRALAVAAALAAAVAPVGPGARMTTQAVVHVWVADDRDRQPTNLQPADFDLFVDGGAIPVDSVTPRAQPVSVAILLDVTRSVFWRGQPIDRELGQFATSLGTAGRLLVGTIGGRTGFTTIEEAEDVRGEVTRLIDPHIEDGYGNSPVWDVVHQAVTVLSREPEPRAIVLLTDGRATGDHYGMVETADRAMAHNVAVHIIVKHTAQRIYQGGTTAVLVQPGAPLQGVAAYTGGQFFTYPERQHEAALGMFGLLASGLRGLHAFHFTPPQLDGAPHRLEIRARRPGIKVHAPMAFIAPRG